MVQRKVQNKLAIQADPNVKMEKRLVNLKPSSQLQDGKNRGGADLKKKMKKSRSTKHSDIENLRSPSPSSSLPLRKSMSQPGKPLPLNVQSIAAAAAAAAADPLKQALTKTSDGSAPNYMKSTSCSDARKEQSQVSVRNSAVISDSRNQNRRNLSSLKLSSGSINRPAKTSSLKLMRTLIKSPSFKPARASARKNSRVSLCEDVNIQKPTCSSTLKDSKFPKYLMISPGGTEAEGTSVMKVCPYTYCSLNGHHHRPVAPLKCFLSARRRSLKNQKMVKLQALSPRKAKPSNKGISESDLKQTFFDDDEKPAQQEVEIDYFVEVFAKSKEDDSQTIMKNVHEAEITDSFPREEQKEDVANEENLPSLEQDESAMRSCSSESESDEFSSIEVDYANSEASDMEWEEGKVSLAEWDEDDDKESDSNAGLSFIQDGDMHEEPVIKSDAIVSICNDIIHDYYQVLQDLFKEKIPCAEIQLKNDGTKQNFNIEDCDRMSYDHFSYTEDSFEEDNELSETEIEISSSSIEEPIENLTATGEEIQEENGIFEADDHQMESHLGDVESHCTAYEKDEASDSQPRNEFQEGTTMSTSNKISNAAQDISTTYEAEANAEKQKSETNHNAVTVVSGNQMEEAQKVDDSKSSADIQFFDSANTVVVYDEDDSKVTDNADTAEDCKPGQNVIDSEDNLANGEYMDNAKAENYSFRDEDQRELKKEKISMSTKGEEQSDLNLKEIHLAENSVGDNDRMEVDKVSEPDAADTIAIHSTSPGMKRKFSQQESNSDEELLNTNRKWKISCRRTIQEEEVLWNYTQREPNYLPLVPGPEAEKVDLRHQMLDEKKNAEEWMLDFAIQQAVTKLAPARKKKVALLVEAFEKVMPVPKYEPRLKHSSATFTHARPMQACS